METIIPNDSVIMRLICARFTQVGEGEGGLLITPDCTQSVHLVGQSEQPFVPAAC